MQSQSKQSSRPWKSGEQDRATGPDPSLSPSQVSLSIFKDSNEKEPPITYENDF